MLRSMTGYGRAQKLVDGYNILVEIKSVNHRYFEFSSRITRGYGFLEEKLKSYIKERVSRGKLDCYVQIEAVEISDIEVQVNHTVAGSYIAALNEIAERYNLINDISVTAVSRYSDIFSIKKAEADEERIWKALEEALSEAVEAFIKMRELEGRKLESDIVSRGNAILDKVDLIERRSPQTVSEYREKIEARIKELLEDARIDEQRLLTETAIFADKIAVDEETVRLRSHIEQLNKLIKGDSAVGRKLDFLVQEINREGNTIGSKAQDVEIARWVVDIKADVEKIREQVQNIE